ncbi:helix-turn-helix domain-containing protein [Hymenobacter glacieicola]|uniref:Helix-turn-helix domain-containing protein n=1 Tax=Hymenobacter glacieicola TaxID=1562124 RepID=A0ABQ1WH19_9BACT|nr:helix-turn-helix domain-containing protein [Hymenobacter glacieicola]GGG29219.1 hypothetical protein GCM10011378_02350 [Hymenobacter glacieicola]
MQNPFDTIQAQLDELKQMVNRALAQNITPEPPAVGGIELAQEILRLSKPRIYALCSQRKLPVMKRGGRLSFSRTELLAWLAEGKREVKAQH